MWSKIDLNEVLTGKSDWIDSELARKLAEPSIKCIQREFPHHSPSFGPEGEINLPKKDHPLFYGCYDWHSSVHSHWNLVRQVRLIDNHPLKGEILSLFEKQFEENKIKKEIAYLDRNKTFEKPYGWGWFLRLISELYLWDYEESESWEEILKPLEDKIIELTKNKFLRQERPLRVGIHGNSAFSLINILDYARIKSTEELESIIVDKSKEFFIDDKESPVNYEPIGWDFLSPTLTEADLMRRVLDKDEYTEWLDGFLPDLNETSYSSFLEPIKVELDDLMKYHLVGLNLSKAWTLCGIESNLPKHHRLKKIIKESSEKHAEEGLKQTFTSDYGGSHWLLSFALYLFTMDESGIAP